MSQSTVNEALAATEEVTVFAGSEELKGLVLCKKYRLIEEIGAGGMGSIWRAERIGWTGHIAIKLMQAIAVGSERDRRRFAEEAKFHSSVRSPNLVHIFDNGVDEKTQIPFIAMELLEGRNLGQLLHKHKTLPLALTLRIAEDVARALASAHKAGFVHRDLKPQNIFVCDGEEGDPPLIKLIDFGVAKWLEDSAISPSLTRKGSMVGTPHYSSPEQIRGTAAGSTLVDVWSLAVVLYECITGQRAFDGVSLPVLAVEICGQGTRPTPSSVCRVPSGFDEWFARAVHPEIARRFQSPKELVEGLRCCRETVKPLPPALKTRITPARQLPSALESVTDEPVPREVATRANHTRRMGSAPPVARKLPPSKPTTRAPLTRERLVRLLALGAAVGGGLGVAVGGYFWLGVSRAPQFDASSPLAVEQYVSPTVSATPPRRVKGVEAAGVSDEKPDSAFPSSDGVEVKMGEKAAEESSVTTVALSLKTAFAVNGNGPTPSAEAAPLATDIPAGTEAKKPSKKEVKVARRGDSKLPGAEKKRVAKRKKRKAKKVLTSAAKPAAASPDETDYARMTGDPSHPLNGAIYRSILRPTGHPRATSPRAARK